MLPGVALSEADLESLKSRWIDAGVAQSALLRRLTDAEGRAEFGGRPKDARAGILIPYYRPGDTSDARGYRIRRDRPDVDAKGKVSRKYLAPAGSHNMLYFHPEVDAEDLKNADLPIVITEGEFKALALYALSWHGLPDTALVPRWLSVALSGTWNWRTAVETTEEDRAEKVTGPLPDWDWLHLDGRRVVILFDADIDINEQVRAARDKLAEWLTRDRHANVFYAYVPRDENKPHVKGVDDWLADVGPDEVLAAIEKAKPSRIKAAKPNKENSDLYKDIRLFRTRSREVYASVERGKTRQVMKVDSQDFQNYLTRRMLQRDGGTVPPEPMNLRRLASLCVLALTIRPPAWSLIWRTRIGKLSRSPQKAGGFAMNPPACSSGRDLCCRCRSPNVVAPGKC